MRGPETRRSSRRAGTRVAAVAAGHVPSDKAKVRAQTLDPITFASAIARSAARSRHLADSDVAVSSVLAAALPQINGHAALVLAIKHAVIASTSAETMGLNIAKAERRSLLRIAKQALTTGKPTSRAEAIDTDAGARAALFATPLHQGDKIIGALAIALPHIRPADADAPGGIALLRDCVADMLIGAEAEQKPARKRSAVSERLNLALASHSDGVALFGKEGGLITANAAFAKAHGAESTALKSLTLEEILQRSHDGFGPLLLARDLRNDADDGAELALSASGEWLRLSRQRIANGDEMIIQTPAGGEIAAAAQARQKLHAAKRVADAREAAWQAFSLGAIVLTKAGRVEDCNGAVARMLGVEQDDLIGRRLGRLGKLDLGDGADQWRMVGRARSGGSKLAARAKPFGDGQVLVILAPMDDMPNAEQAPGAQKPPDTVAFSRAETAIQALGELGHEMRTPLNAVLGFTDVLLAKSFGPINTRQGEYLQDIATAGHHMLEMVEHLLSHARLTAGRYAIDPEWRSLQQVLTEAARMMQPIAKKAGIGLSAPMAPSIEINVDHHGFFQVLINLLTNAIKFTPQGGQVALTATATGTGLEVTIVDTGDGIPADMVGQVMEPFTQARRSGSQALKGAGLGLSIAHSLVELHGGDLKIASKEGSGTTVTVRLPAALVRPLKTGSKIA